MATYVERESQPLGAEGSAIQPTRTPVYFDTAATTRVAPEVERFELAGLRGALFQRYRGSIVGNLREDATVLDSVRPLVRFAGKLPQYSQHCLGLSATAEPVRDAFRGEVVAT